MSYISLWCWEAESPWAFMHSSLGPAKQLQTQQRPVVQL